MQKTLVVNLEDLGEKPYSSILCYPRCSKTELEVRLSELRRLGIKALGFAGERQAFNIPVLGRGCVGIVTIAYIVGEKAALKTRRVDADRSTMQREAEMLREANYVHVGPRLLGVSNNFLLMQFIDGCLVPDWLRKQRRRTRVRKVLHRVLEQCWRLDKVGLDHGELSHAPKHIIINQSDEPFIVDFETASLGRKPSNVTSICQFLFIGGSVAEKVAEKLSVRDKEAIIHTLKDYKNDTTRENFRNVLYACGL